MVGGVRILSVYVCVAVAVVVVAATPPFHANIHTFHTNTQTFSAKNQTKPSKEPNESTNLQNVLCKSCACGLPNRMQRIVGGWPTKVNEYPWVVALTIRGQFFCGGTIINDLYILTAAHCVNTRKNTELTVVLAEHNKATMSETMVETRHVSKILTHEGFSEGVQYDNDIALLRLDRRLKFRVDVAPICMPPSGDQFSGGLGRVTGWGHTKEGGPASMELLETHVAVMANSACHQQPGYGPGKVTENMMCAGVMGGGRDTCQGDSGGSLIIEDWQGRMFQAGIVSWGIGCARPNRPGVYTRVNAYLPWIIKHTKDGCYCY